jgi:hypothetical protein
MAISYLGEGIMWRRGPIIWSPVEIDYLKLNREVLPIDQLALALAKSRNAVSNKMKELDGKAVKKVGKGRTKIGKRKDLGIFMRSGWEANVARWIKHEGLTYMYEPKNFFFDQFKHGTTSYVPDFLVDNNYWIEVKGMLKNSDRTRIRRFKKFYPDEFKKLKAVCNPKTAADKFFTEMGVPVAAYYRDLDKKYKSIIPEWE